MLMTGTGMNFADALSGYSSAWTAVTGFITGNAALMLFLFGGIVTMVWKHFKRAKKAVR